jgi:hypothetical protein
LGYFWRGHGWCFGMSVVSFLSLGLLLFQGVCCSGGSPTHLARSPHNTSDSDCLVISTTPHCAHDARGCCRKAPCCPGASLLVSLLCSSRPGLGAAPLYDSLCMRSRECCSQAGSMELFMRPGMWHTCRLCRGRSLQVLCCSAVQVVRVHLCVPAACAHSATRTQLQVRCTRAHRRISALSHCSVPCFAPEPCMQQVVTLEHAACIARCHTTKVHHHLLT